MARNAIYKKAVQRILPSAIPIDLEKVDEFSPGKILVYSQKPKKLIPMRRHDLDFTGVSLQSVLAENQDLTLTTARSSMCVKETKSSTVKVDVTGDLELSYSLSEIALCEKFDFKADKHKSLNITTDFGKITHVSTDLASSIIGGNIKVKRDHPIVARAIENGGVMFIITTIYEAEHSIMSIKLSTDATEGSDSAGDTCAVVSRDLPTTLAYLVLKVSIDSKGFISFKYDSNLRKVKEGIKSHLKSTSMPIKTSSVYRAASSELDTYEDWVLVEAETTKITGNPTTGGTTAVSKPEQDVLVKKDILGSAPPQPTSISSAKVEDKVVVPEDETDGDIDEHLLYSIKDFQPFESMTYRGIYEESKKWVVPFRANQKLQDAFFVFSKPPRSYEKLNILSAYFLEVGDALRSEKPIPPNKEKGIDPILSALSENPEVKLDEVSSAIIVAEAADEFVQHIYMKILNLSAEKRKLLTDVILKTPYGMNNHGYADAGPFNDPELKSIMSRMGFNIAPNTHNLVHTFRESEGEEDKLAASLILMLASEK